MLSLQKYIWNWTLWCLSKFNIHQLESLALIDWATQSIILGKLYIHRDIVCGIILYKQQIKETLIWFGWTCYNRLFILVSSAWPWWNNSHIHLYNLQTTIGANEWLVLIVLTFGNCESVTSKILKLWTTNI